ncbi:MAG: hypothetical protein H7Z16_03500 [Pyrinomonadaceae bacterium]|nr:hypothetical protein [Pyrinomonadaceae bacterium]
METLISFLKSSTVVDLLVLLLIFFITVIMIPVGIWIALASQRRMPSYIFLLSALLPLLLALIGTCLRLLIIEQAISMNQDVGNEVVAASRQEAWITTYIGAAAAAVLGLIAVMSLVTKKVRKA